MTERQKYELIKVIAGVEIRKYHPCVMADVVVESDYEKAGNLGFRPLVTYISQNNIAMTAPVIQEENQTKSWIVSFVMPENMKLTDLPTPKNTKVTLREVPTHHAAALIFRGITTSEKVKEKEKELRTILNATNIKIAGPLKIARFDPPWKPGFMRHNEVVLPIIY